MEEEKKNNNKSKIIAIVASVLIIVAAVVTLIVVNLNKGDDPINADYFHSTDRRIVYEPDYKGDEEMTYGANRVFEVYQISGENVTGYAVYYEYSDEYAAQKNSQKIMTATSRDHYVKEVKQIDNYVAEIHTDEDLMYKSASDIRAEIESKLNYRKLIEEIGEDVL